MTTKANSTARLWRDEFAHKTFARRATPWGEVGKWSDRDDGLTANWLHHQDIRVPKEVAGQGVEIVAGDRTFHPVWEHLQSLKWDGSPRLHEWPQAGTQEVLKL
jgi:putative DNA primase/helicase